MPLKTDGAYPVYALSKENIDKHQIDAKIILIKYIGGVILYRLSASITEEAAEILKREAKRYGTSMGAVITKMLLDKQREDLALQGIAIYQQEQAKKE